MKTAESVTVEWIGKRIGNGFRIEKHYPDGAVFVRYYASAIPAAIDPIKWMHDLWDTPCTWSIDTPPYHQRAQWTIDLKKKLEERQASEAAAALGRMTSESKAAAARENGRKGGRPRKA